MMQALDLLPKHLTSADTDDPSSVLSTSTLPRSITTSSDGLPALQWLFSKLQSNPVLDEALTTHACCVEVGVTPAVFASCLVDMERRGFIERVRGWIALLAVDFDSSKLHSCSSDVNITSLLAQHVHVYGDQSAIPDCFERIVIFTPNISADEYGCACDPWTSSFTSASAISTHEMEQDLLNMMTHLSNSNPIIRSQPMDEMLICHVLEQGGGSITELARSSVCYTDGVPVIPHTPACAGGDDCSYCVPKAGEVLPKMPFGQVYQMCTICLDDKPCVVLPCGHAFCHYDLTQQISSAMRGAETRVAEDSGGQSLFQLRCSSCESRLQFSFICAIVPDLVPQLRKQLFSSLLTKISGGSSPFARCTCGDSVFIGVSHECEVLCDSCGVATTVGDCKRGLSTSSIYPHPGVTSDSAFQWYAFCFCYVRLVSVCWFTQLCQLTYYQVQFVSSRECRQIWSFSVQSLPRLRCHQHTMWLPIFENHLRRIGTMPKRSLRPHVRSFLCALYEYHVDVDTAPSQVVQKLWHRLVLDLQAKRGNTHSLPQAAKRSGFIKSSRALQTYGFGYIEVRELRVASRCDAAICHASLEGTSPTRLLHERCF